MAAWLDGHVEPPDMHEAWTDVVRQWLTLLAGGLGPQYAVHESPHFLLLGAADGRGERLLRFAETCHHHLLQVTSGLTDFATPGKLLVVALGGGGEYDRYLHSQGFEAGGSAGVHVREGYPHVALWGVLPGDAENTLAHELVHAGLEYLGMPQWCEEGLAQMFEHDATGRNLLQLDPERAREHKCYWQRHGLGDFWFGRGFSREGKGQRLCYELAEVLLRLLWEDHKPRWFGLVRGPRERFFRFQREAEELDAGQAAARQHLGLSLGGVAALFLGQGDWEPPL